MVKAVLRLLSVGGTRPEAIKLAPIALAAAGRAGLDHRILATGQQGDRFDAALREFGLAPDLRLAPVDCRADPETVVSRLVAALLPVLAERRPDLVIVQGDTSSALAGAMAAHDLGISVGHVEAGLRSGDLDNPWPEERNRIAIDAIAMLLFAPTARAAAVLSGEAAVQGGVSLTGNTGIDALFWMRSRIDVAQAPTGTHRILLTCHRRESFGAGIDAICRAALHLADRPDVRILCPLHGNPAAGEHVCAKLAGHPRITLTAGLDYRALVTAMASSRLILTDSGGIQEEAPALGIPTLVLRAVTERPEAVATGNLRLVGTDPAAIVAAAIELLDDPATHARMARPALPFGDGDAAARILDIVERAVAHRRRDDRQLPSGRFETMDGDPAGV